MSSSNGSLVTTINLKAKYIYCVAAMLFCILQKYDLYQSIILFEDLLPNQISALHLVALPLTSTSKVRMAVMMALLMVEN
jgi:hypothetical protein